MKALRFHGAKDVRLDEVEEPICGAGQVKIRPKFVGICGTDLHEYLAGPLLTPRTPHALTKESIPVTLGHEFSGVVEEVGDGVEDIRSGDQVVVFPTLYDGTCDACLRGYENCCTSLGAVGFTGWGGGLSEHVVLPRNHVYALPKNVPLDIGALIEPLSVAWHAVKASSFKPDDYVLILGGGPIGLGILQVLKAQKAQHVIVSEVAPGRKEFATQFGADLVLDPREDGLISRCRDYCEERGPDIVFDAAGVQEGLDLAIRVSRVGATIVNIAAWERPATINPMEMIIGEKKYVGTMTYVRRDFEEVLDAVASGLLQPGKMITGRISLDRVEEDGLKALIRDKDKNVKILVEI